MEGLFARDMYGETVELDLGPPYRTFAERDDSAFWKTLNPDM